VLKKIFNILILGGLVALVFYWFYQDFDQPEANSMDTLSAIPPTAAIIIEVADITDVWRDLTAESLVWEELQATDYFFKLNEIGQNMDSLFRNDSKLRSVLSRKPVAISAHMTGGQDYAFLFALQLELDIDRNEVYEAIQTTFRASENDSRIYDGENINSFMSPFFDSRVFYYIKDGLIVLSLAEVLAEESVRTRVRGTSVMDNEQFSLVRETVDQSVNAYAFINYERLKPILRPHLSKSSLDADFFTQPFADWSALDISIHSDALDLNGFVAASDSSKAWLDAFSKSDAPAIKLLEYLPSNAAYFAFFGYGDYETYRDEKLKKLEKNGSLFRAKAAIDKYDENCDCDAEELGTSWIGSQAVAFITEPSTKEYSQNAFALLEAIDGEEAEDLLKSFGENLGEKEVYEFANKSYFQINVGGFYGAALGAAFERIQNPFVARLGDVIVMANSENAIRSYLSAIEEGRTFVKTGEYEDLSESLFADAHFVLYSSLAKSPEIMKNVFDEKYDSDIEKQTEILRNFRSLLYQISHSSGDLFYNNILLKQGSDYVKETGALWEVKLKAEARGKTHLVKNHYTGVLETLVQDANDRLYLISHNGKIIWESTIDGPIIGSVKQIDVYKNKKLQMLFNTASSLYLLDRNGNPVESFPIELENDATAEVSVADYDNSRDYRIFIPTLGEQILCYDAYGNSVEGWEYEGGKGEVRLPIKHLRIKRKDFLFSLTDQNKILLLNRRGEMRHEVIQKAFGFRQGGYELVKGDKIQASSFYYADSSGTVYSLGFDEGLEKLTPRPNTQSDYFFADLNADSAMDFGFLFPESVAVFSFQGDILFETDLPEGEFDHMKYHQFGDAAAISLLNSTQNEVLVLDVFGEPIKGFPVYGSSIPSIGDLNKDGFPDLVTTGKLGFVYAYSIELEK